MAQVAGKVVAEGVELEVEALPAEISLGARAFQGIKSVLPDFHSVMAAVNTLSMVTGTLLQVEGMTAHQANQTGASAQAIVNRHVHAHKNK